MPIANYIDWNTIHRHYRQAQRRLLLLDYDGTLVPFAKNPAEAIPDSSVKTILETATQDPINTLAVISGRTRYFLEQHLSINRLILIAEHGAFIRVDKYKWKKHVDVNAELLKWIANFLGSYLPSCPGAFIEIKETAVVWHYRECEDKLGVSVAQQIDSDYQNRRVSDFSILPGNKVLEFKPANIHKGFAVHQAFNLSEYDFILVMGDDVNDEAMFSVVPTHAYTIKIGKEITSARYRLMRQSEATQILQSLILNS